MKLKTNISLMLVLLNIISNIRFGKCQKGRKRDLMEDIQKTVNSISNSVDKNELKLSSFESSIALISNRVEKIIDSIDHNKLNTKFLDEKLDKLDTKIRTIEESMNDKIKTITENVELIANDVKRIDLETDAKLRKIMNIISDTYELSKDVTLLMKGRSGAGYIGNGDNEGPDQIEDMQKKLLEQMSIVETSIVSQLSSVSKIGRETLTSLDNINLEMLNMRDECQSRKSSQTQLDKSSADSDSLYSSIRTGRDSHSSQCPNVNMSALTHQMESQFNEISVKIDNDFTVIESKINEYMTSCNTNTNTNGRSIPPLSRPPIIVNSSSNVYTPSRRSITLESKSRTGCQHSSELLAPKNCAELRKSGADCDGVYIINIANTRMMRVYCDMTDNGGGWTVILRRGEFGKSRHKISFEQDWISYRNGFGNMDSGEFWLGLENIYKLSVHEEQILQVDLESFDGDYVSVVYDNFKVGSEADNYRLHLGHPIQSNTTVAQSLIAHNTSMFSTHDRNNAISDDNCAAKLKGGWWFHNCHSAMLTAPYYVRSGSKHVWAGIQWHSWKHTQHLKAAQMKIKSKH